MLNPGRIALGALTLSLAASAAPAQAQQTMSSSMELGGDRLSISQLEMQRLSDLGNALTATPALQDRAIAAARAVAVSPDARHAFASYALEIAQRRHDNVLRAEALDILIVSRRTRPERLVSYLAARGEIAYRAGDYALASTHWTRVAELQPNDPQSLMNLAQVREALQDPGGATTLIRRAIALPRPGNAPVPEIWFRQWLSIAYNGHQQAETAAAGHALLAAYPNAANWRFALTAYRQLLNAQPAAEIDMLRLMRATRTFNQSNEYQRLAQLLIRANLPAEARATLDDGIARNIVGRDTPPIPDIGREIDRALARQTGPSALLTAGGLQSAAMLALAGRRAEAEPILRALADGGSQGWEKDLAGFWLLWLTRPA
jgi:tetratricopeptide (TPR) repeat protein